MTESKVKKSIKEISPIDVYMLLPRTNCKECGEANCMAFATKLVNLEVSVELCPPFLEEEHKDSFIKLRAMLAPTIKTVIIGSENNSVKIGGK